MRGLSLPSSPKRRRVIAFVLALAFEVLFLLAFLTPFSPFQRKTEPAMTTMALRPAEKAQSSTRATAKAKSAQSKAPPPRPLAPDPNAPPPPPSFVPLSREDFAAGDISKLSSHKGEGETGTQTAGTSYGPGEGPNGAPLYNAEWYREPTPGELALYLPKGGPRPGSALIMCQTAPNYRVENCRGLGETPPGSGLASALRQAAWQFKVRPPRIGGKPIIGAWVRIRFDWYERKEG
jgi:protein TonB